MNQSPFSSEAAPRLPTASAANATDKMAAPNLNSASLFPPQVNAEYAGRVGAYSSGTLTPRQSDALAFIRNFQAENGFGPSYDEIRLHLGLSTRSSVHRIVHGLVERGALRKRFGTRRDFEIAGQADAMHHLRALLGCLRKNSFVWRNEAVVLEAMQFVGWRK